MNRRDDRRDRSPMPLFREAPRDPRLADALRRRERPGPSDDDALRTRIVRAAGPLLARLRQRPRAWWEWTATWARTVLPVGIAASLFAAMVLVRELRSTDRTDRAVTRRAVRPVTAANSATGANALLLSVATGGAAVADIGDALVARPSDEWLYARVMNSDDERMSP